MGAIFHFLQSLGTSPNSPDFWHMIDSGLVTTSASSLGILRCTLLGPMGFCMFIFLRWSQTWSSLTMKGTSFPQSLTWGSGAWEMHRSGYQWKVRQKNLMTTSASSMLVLTISSFFIRGAKFYLIFFSQSTNLLKPLLLFFMSLAKFSFNCVIDFLISSLHMWSASLYSSQDTCTWFHCLCISFLCFRWSREFYSAVLVSWRLCLISYGNSEL